MSEGQHEDTRERSLQERYFPALRCFGCGPANERGLRLRSFEGPDDAVTAVFLPWPEHDNGLGYLNGGIISTLLDCHGAAAVILAADRRGLAPDGTLQYVTAGLDVRFVRPAPLTDQVSLRALVLSGDESTVVVESQLWFEDKVRAEATSTWKRWRPRTGAAAPPHR